VSDISRVVVVVVVAVVVVAVVVVAVVVSEYISLLHAYDFSPQPDRPHGSFL
jgi:hypothetical protein